MFCRCENLTFWDLSRGIKGISSTNFVACWIVLNLCYSSSWVIFSPEDLFGCNDSCSRLQIIQRAAIRSCECWVKNGMWCAMGTKYVSGFATTFAWNNPTDNGRTVASNFAPRLPLDARRTMSSRLFLRQLIRPQLECQSIDWFSKNNVLLSGSNVYPVNVKKEVE